MCPMHIYGTHCGQPGNATSYPKQHPTTTSVASDPNWLSSRRHVDRNEDGMQSDVVVMDFAKAFDKVCHTRLLHKLHMSGIDPETCGWSRSFFCGRTKRMVLNISNHFSSASLTHHLKHVSFCTKNELSVLYKNHPRVVYYGTSFQRY